MTEGEEEEERGREGKSTARHTPTLTHMFARRTHRTAYETQKFGGIKRLLARSFARQAAHSQERLHSPAAHLHNNPKAEIAL